MEIRGQKNQSQGQNIEIVLSVNYSRVKT